MVVFCTFASTIWLTALLRFMDWIMKGALAVTGGAGCLVYGASFVPAFRGLGAPFVPIAAEKLQALFGEAGVLSSIKTGASPRSWLRKGTLASELTLVDLGSGDGSVVRAAARQAGFRSAVGYEVNPALAAYATARATHNEIIHWQSLWTAPLHTADVVFVFGKKSIMNQLGHKLRAELPVGAVVVSNAYELPRQWLGPPTDVLFVETRSASWTAGLRDVSSHLFCYTQSTESRSSMFWQQDARRQLYQDVARRGRS